MVKLEELSKKLTPFLKKYKYAVLILLLGIALLLLPTGKNKKAEETIPEQTAITDENYAALLEARLTEMLSQIHGAGKVEVMLTLRRGSQTQYQTDIQTNSNGDGNQKSEERKTVILSEGSAYDKAAISTVEYPQFMGALIICEGAEKPTVRLDLIEAVSALTGLSSEQITVVKMK